MNGPVMVDLEGTSISSKEEELLKHPMTGALILFSRNFDKADQLKALIAKVREIRPGIIIGVDQEGGNVQRFQRRGFRSWPAVRVYGDVYDLNPVVGLQLAQNYGQKMGLELASYDIDLDFAPVLDLHNDNEVIGKLDRAFHADFKINANLGCAFADGLHSAGVSAVGKHFPDHSTCEGDSHFTKPISNITLEALRKTHLWPFLKAIQEEKIKGMMPAHITFTHIDPENPVGFSKKWLQEILRKECQFEGAIISDCLSMKGAEVGTMSERAKLALDAGCDIVIICNQTRDLVQQVLDDLSSSYQQNELSQRRIAALARVNKESAIKEKLETVLAGKGPVVKAENPFKGAVLPSPGVLE